MLKMCLLSRSEEKGIRVESDRFLTNPLDFATEFAKNWTVPSHIVLFDSEERPLKDFLISHSFKEVRDVLFYIVFVTH